jgi:hypothetical protein
VEVDSGACVPLLVPGAGWLWDCGAGEVFPDAAAGA